MVQVYLSLGSNIIPRKYYIAESIKLLERKIEKFSYKSSIYETDSWGYNDKPYLNKIVSCKTNINPYEILKIINNIEKELGRKIKTKKNKNGKYIYDERTIDIDILFYGSLILKSEKLTIPHQRLHLRNFVLKPLNEIAPNFVHPVIRKKISLITKNCKDKLKAERK